MLSLRVILFAGAFGLALWALFALLDTLREPELLRSPKTAVVKGCDALETDIARGRCPELFCLKALLDRGVAPRDARFEVTSRASAHERELIEGLARTRTQPAPLHFVCILERGRVETAQIAPAAEIGELRRAFSAGGVP